MHQEFFGPSRKLQVLKGSLNVTTVPALGIKILSQLLLAVFYATNLPEMALGLLACRRRDRPLLFYKAKVVLSQTLKIKQYEKADRRDFHHRYTVINRM